jgi:hypothetical protein
MRSVLLSLVCVSTVWGQLEPKEIVRKAIVNYGRDWREQRKWAWTETDTTASDETKEIEVGEVAPLYGTPYERLIRKNGHPLSAEEQRREDRKYQRARKERENESPAERAARIRKYDESREFIADVPEAFNFKLIREETIDGRPAWVIQMTPRPGFLPTAPHAAMMEHLNATMWVDKQDFRLAKAQDHVIDTISIGWILARVGPGTNFEVDQTRVANGIWMPSILKINGFAHVLLVHSKSLNEELAYSGYRPATSVSAEKQ